MSLLLLEGPAGSGKTAGLIGTLASVLQERPLGAHERVLAITKMHGSRRRLRERLTAVPGLGYQFECLTADSFAWRIVNRWRSLGRIRFGEDAHFGDYREVCRRAGVLLNEPVVACWVGRTFPIVIIDEMQDSKEGQLLMIQGLSTAAICLAAADYYQDLDNGGPNPAVIWAREHAEVVTLTRIHRTKAAGLLEAAEAIRSGRSVPSNGRGFTVLGAYSYNDGAKYVSQNLSWWRAKGYRDFAIISPSRAQRAAFVRNLIRRVEKGPVGKEQKLGPHKIPWEVSQQEEEEGFLAKLNLPDDPEAMMCASDLVLPVGLAASSAVAAWLDRQRRIAGRTTFSVPELRNQICRIYQRARAFRMTTGHGVRAMTIHQAKNREFDAVIVLWPYEVKGSSERLRRLLYNAITRAKRETLVIVQNPDRIQRPPFMSDT